MVDVSSPPTDEQTGETEARRDARRHARKPAGDIEIPSASVAVERGQSVTPELVRRLIEGAVQQTWGACLGRPEVVVGGDGQEVCRLPWSTDLGVPEVRTSVAADGSTHFVIMPRLVWEESDARMADGRQLRMRVGDTLVPLGAVPPSPAAQEEE